MHASSSTHLLLIHHTLRRGLDRIVQVAETQEPGSTRDFADFVDLYLRFLTLHHEGEDQFLFPALRKAGTLRTSDVAFLEARIADHGAVHSTSDALGAAARELRAQGTAAFQPLQRIAGELRAMLVPHLRAEEESLTPTHLAEMISAPALEASQQEMVARDEKLGGPQVLMFLIHSLAPEEQRALLGEMPWFVRKVLVRRVWERSYRRFLPFAFTRTVAL